MRTPQGRVRIRAAQATQAMGNEEILGRVYTKLLQARVPGKYQDQLKDVDREEGILNLLEYLMYKIENDGDLEPECMTESVSSGAPVHPVLAQGSFDRCPSKPKQGTKLSP